MANGETGPSDAVLTDSETVSDIMPIRIGILNLMPRDVQLRTYDDWKSLALAFGTSVVFECIKFDKDPRESSRTGELIANYRPYSSVRAELDGLIITGANLERRKISGSDEFEALPYEDISYYEQLCAVIEDANSSVLSTIYSCLASNIVLWRRFGLIRNMGSEKIFGIFEHQIVQPKSGFMADLGMEIVAPHSHWGYVSDEEVSLNGIVKILATSQKTGWMAAEMLNKRGSLDLLLPAHIEYGPSKIPDEYLRDLQAGYDQPPLGYTALQNAKDYLKECAKKGVQPNGSDVLSPSVGDWREDAVIIMRNWIYYINRTYAKTV